MSETRQAEILIDVIDSDNEMAAFDLHGWQLRSAFSPSPFQRNQNWNEYFSSKSFAFIYVINMIVLRWFDVFAFSSPKCSVSVSVANPFIISWAREEYFELHFGCRVPWRITICVKMFRSICHQSLIISVLNAFKVPVCVPVSTRLHSYLRLCAVIRRTKATRKTHKEMCSARHVSCVFCPKIAEHRKRTSAQRSVGKQNGCKIHFGFEMWQAHAVVSDWKSVTLSNGFPLVFPCGMWIERAKKETSTT